MSFKKSFWKEDTLLILLSAWDRSCDLTAKTNLSKDNWWIYVTRNLFGLLITTPSHPLEMMLEAAEISLKSQFIFILSVTWTNLYYTSLVIIQCGEKLTFSCLWLDINITKQLIILKMKVISIILVFSFLMIDGQKQFGLVQHQKSLKTSNKFPANDRVKKKKKKLRGH